MRLVIKIYSVVFVLGLVGGCSAIFDSENEDGTDTSTGADTDTDVDTDVDTDADTDTDTDIDTDTDADTDTDTDTDTDADTDTDTDTDTDSDTDTDTCPPNTDDCDSDSENGCEADLLLNPNCGECFVFCSGECLEGICEDCDGPFAVDSNDPVDGAEAIGLCSGFTSAEYLEIDGIAMKGAAFDLGHGILDGFGTNVSTTQGQYMLALSSGTARQPTDDGYESPQGFDKQYSSGFPYGFPKESPACPGVVTGEPHDSISLVLEIDVPEAATGFAFDFKFYTFEFPDYVCSVYNDFAVAIVEPFPNGQSDGNVLYDSQGNPLSVNSAFLQVCEAQEAGGITFDCELGTAELEGTGFEGHGATGWLTATVPVEGGTSITIRFGVWDSGDGILDSTFLVDNWRWLTEEDLMVGMTPAFE